LFKVLGFEFFQLGLVLNSLFLVLADELLESLGAECDLFEVVLGHSDQVGVVDSRLDFLEDGHFGDCCHVGIVLSINNKLLCTNLIRLQRVFAESSTPVDDVDQVGEVFGELDSRLSKFWHVLLDDIYVDVLALHRDHLLGQLHVLFEVDLDIDVFSLVVVSHEGNQRFKTFNKGGRCGLAKQIVNFLNLLNSDLVLDDRDSGISQFICVSLNACLFILGSLHLAIDTLISSSDLIDLGLAGGLLLLSFIRDGGEDVARAAVRVSNLLSVSVIIGLQNSLLIELLATHVRHLGN